MLRCSAHSWANHLSQENTIALIARNSKVIAPSGHEDWISSTENWEWRGLAPEEKQEICQRRMDSGQ